jgi:hypothetical protein
LTVALLAFAFAGCIEKKENNNTLAGAEEENHGASSESQAPSANETAENSGASHQNETNIKGASESIDASVFTVLFDEDDVVTKAYTIADAPTCVETEKTHDGKRFVYPFRGSSEVRIFLSWEPTEICKELGISGLSPVNTTDASKQYSVSITRDMWYDMLLVMVYIQDSTVKTGIALDVNYHITVWCNGIPPTAPNAKETRTIEGDIQFGACAFSLVPIPVPQFQMIVEKFTVPENAVRVDVNCSWAPEQEWLRFTIIDAAGEEVAFRGLFGMLGCIVTSSRPPMNTAISPVHNFGEWQIEISDDLNVMCHYKIDVVIYT